MSLWAYVNSVLLSMQTNVTRNSHGVQSLYITCNESNIITFNKDEMNNTIYMLSFRYIYITSSELDYYDLDAIYINYLLGGIM